MHKSERGCRKVLENIGALAEERGMRSAFGMNILCGYHILSRDDFEKARSKGRVLAGLLAKVHFLYARAIRQNDRGLLGLFESGILHDRSLRELHRKVFLERAQEGLPLVFRVDAGSMDGFLELHAGFRGLGDILAARLAMEEVFGRAGELDCKRFARFSRHICGSIRMPAVFYKPSGRFDETAFFLSSVLGKEFSQASSLSPGALKARLSTLLQACPRHFLSGFSKRGLPFVRRMFFAAGAPLMRAYLEGAFDIEPAPSLLLEQKSWLALLHDPEYGGLFGEGERGLFAQSRIIKNGSKLDFSGEQYLPDDIARLPAAKRKFVVKYAGLDMDINWGSRAVFRLSRETHRSAARIISRACSDFEERREPWIIQQDISGKESIDYFDRGRLSLRSGDFYRIYRIHFVYYPRTADADIADIVALFSPRFKVHCQRDAVYGLVSVG